MLVDNTFSAFGTKQFWRGFQIGCYNCHPGPNSENGTTNSPAVARNLSASTPAEIPVAVALQATDVNNNILTFRVVASPDHGTVSLSGKTATYFPAPGYVGNDSFTYAAWDGATDSNPGTVSLTVTPEACVLAVNAFVPAAALPNSLVPFRAAASLSKCVAPIACDWDFGDGSSHATEFNAGHTYANDGDYAWKLTVTANGVSRSLNGVVTISPTLGPPLTLSITNLDFMVQLTWLSDRIPTALESSFDLTQPYSWQPVTDEPWLDATNLTLQTYVLPGQQSFRLRRVP
jgi:hypothetical protein